MTENTSASTNYSRSALVEAFGPTLEFDKPLAPHTSFKTGGPARLFLRATSAGELVTAMAAARRLRIPFMPIGGGSNLLVSDNGYPGLIIRVDVRGIRRLDDNQVWCGAGEDLMALVDFATAEGLSGLEFAAGIWGTVGGAIYGNAGAYGGDMAGIVRVVSIVDPDGNQHDVDSEYCAFGYRDSFFKRSKDIVTSAEIRLESGESLAIQARVDEILASRECKHPTDGQSAGCFFKNIPDPEQPFGKLPAGKLLDEIGAKGMRVGGAEVYRNHANIIVNTGNATSKDIRTLADKLKERVRDRFGILLQEEIIEVGDI